MQLNNLVKVGERPKQETQETSRTVKSPAYVFKGVGVELADTLGVTLKEATIYQYCSKEQKETNHYIRNNKVICYNCKTAYAVNSNTNR